VSSVYDHVPVENSAPTRAAKQSMVTATAAPAVAVGPVVVALIAGDRAASTSGGHARRHRHVSTPMTASSTAMAIHAGRHVPAASEASTTSGPRLVPTP
jgi:hypothetical protein